MNGVVEIPLSGRVLRREPGPAGCREDAVTLPAFFAGPENRLVEVAVQSVLEGADNAYSPVVFCGRSGTGKSHLAFGLAHAWKARFRGRTTVYVTATDFARHLTDAIQTKTVDDFAARYRRASLLVVEDVGHLADKPAAQQELTCTLDALLKARGHVVATARAIPGQLGGIMPGLRSRLAAGLAVPLMLPGRETRLAILRRLSDLLGVGLSDAAAAVLADGLNVTVPELFGALTQLYTQARLDDGLVDVESARRYVAERKDHGAPSLRQIALTTAKQFSLTLKELRGPSQGRRVATARGVAMYLARALTTESLAQIGRYFGHRDHTTVSHGCRKTYERCRTQSDIHNAVLALQERLQTP